jgi:hypothetical protein
MGGTNHYYNLQITNISTNNERGNKTSFWINKTLYQVKETEKINDIDKIANYHYNEKKYGIIILQEEINNNRYIDDDKPPETYYGSDGRTHFWYEEDYDPDGYGYEDYDDDDDDDDDDYDDYDDDDDDDDDDY